MRPDGRRLAIGDGWVRLWVVEPSARRLVTDSYTAMAVTGLSWRPDGQAIACTRSADIGGTVSLWREQPDDEHQPIDASGARFYDAVW